MSYSFPKRPVSYTCFSSDFADGNQKNGFGFDFGAVELDQSSQDYPDELARALNENPDLEVELTGHTDDVGSHKFNMRLSLDRANSLKDELTSRGVDEGRITYGKGETEPLNENKTDQERAENRRVEMRILYPN